MNSGKRKMCESTRLRLGGRVSNRFENDAINDNGVTRGNGTRDVHAGMYNYLRRRRGVMPPAHFCCNSLEAAKHKQTVL